MQARFTFSHRILTDSGLLPAHNQIRMVLGPHFMDKKIFDDTFKTACSTLSCGGWSVQVALYNPKNMVPENVIDR